MQSNTSLLEKAASSVTALWLPHVGSGPRSGLVTFLAPGLDKEFIDYDRRPIIKMA